MSVIRQLARRSCRRGVLDIELRCSCSTTAEAESSSSADPLAGLVSACPLLCFPNVTGSLMCAGALTSVTTAWPSFQQQGQAFPFSGRRLPQVLWAGQYGTAAEQVLRDGHAEYARGRLGSVARPKWLQPPAARYVPRELFLLPIARRILWLEEQSGLLPMRADSVRRKRKKKMNK